MRILLLLFVAFGIVGHTEALQCYNKQHRGDEVKIEECPAVNNKFCYMENNYGEDYRGCGECSDVHIENFNCQDCTENLCNGGDVGKSPFPKCYVQNEGADFNHEESQCYGYDDKSCKMQNCNGKMSRGCGKCGPTDIEDCDCQQCTEDLCNGGDVGKIPFPKCYVQVEGADFKQEERQCYRDKSCKMQKCNGKMSRGCGECGHSDIDDCNCQQCTDDLCNGGEVKNPYPKCYVQEEGADFKYEERQCQYDKSCKMQNCDGKIMRGCGECSTWDKGCNCQNCTEDLCNGGEVKNLAIKCYAQRIDLDYDGSDTEMKEKQCTRRDSNSKFCLTKTCDINGDGVTDRVVRDCGECREDPSCKCDQCGRELCNAAQGIANNLVGTLAIVFVSLMFGKFVMEMTLI